MPEGPGAVLASQPPLWSSLGEEPVGVAALYPARHRGQVSPGRSGFSRAAPPKSLVWGVGCRWGVRRRAGVLGSSRLVIFGWSLVFQGPCLFICVRRELTNRGFQVAWEPTFPVQCPTMPRSSCLSR